MRCTVLRIACLVAAATFAALISSAAAAAPLDLEAARLAIREHYKLPTAVASPYLSPLLGMGRLELEPVGALFDLDSFAAPNALELAARGYALTSGDFDVTIADILESGLFPYQLFDDSQLELRIPAVGSRAYFADELEQDLSELDTPKLLVRYRHRVLNEFTYDYFIRTEFVREPSYLATLRCARFWINPFTGEDMQHAVGMGNYQLLPLAAFIGAPEGAIQDKRLVPAVNLTDQDVGDLGYKH